MPYNRTIEAGENEMDHVPLFCSEAALTSAQKSLYMRYWNETAIHDNGIL